MSRSTLRTRPRIRATGLHNAPWPWPAPSPAAATRLATSSSTWPSPTLIPWPPAACWPSAAAAPVPRQRNAADDHRGTGELQQRGHIPQPDPGDGQRYHGHQVVEDRRTRAADVLHAEVPQGVGDTQREYARVAHRQP